MSDVPSTPDYRAVLRRAICDFIEPMVLSHLSADTEWREAANKFLLECAPLVFGADESSFGVRPDATGSSEATDRPRPGPLERAMLRVDHIARGEYGTLTENDRAAVRMVHDELMIYVRQATKPVSAEAAPLRWETEALRAKGLCGGIVGKKPNERACIKPLGHGPHDAADVSDHAHGDQVTTERGLCVLCESATPLPNRAHVVWGAGHFTCIGRARVDEWFQRREGRDFVLDAIPPADGRHVAHQILFSEAMTAIKERDVLRAQFDDALHLLNATRLILGCDEPMSNIVTDAECVRQLAVNFRGALSRLVESSEADRALRVKEALGVLAGEAYDPAEPNSRGSSPDTGLGVFADLAHGASCMIDAHQISRYGKEIRVFTNVREHVPVPLGYQLIGAYVGLVSGDPDARRVALPEGRVDVLASDGRLVAVGETMTCRTVRVHTDAKPASNWAGIVLVFEEVS